jgi:hypothetical protein
MKIEDNGTINTPLTKVKLEDLVKALRDDHFEIDSFQEVRKYIIKGESGTVEINLEEISPNKVMIKTAYKGNSEEGLILLESAQEMIQKMYETEIDYLT